jgi:splicing factor 3B subunit 1
MTAMAISYLAEASAPYGIEAFESVLEDLWDGMRTHSGRGLAAFLKAIGFVIPLMDPEDAKVYVMTVM